MAVGYLEILRARHATRLLAGTLVGRLPNATAAIAIMLFVRAEGGSYSLAGALVAAYAPPPSATQRAMNPTTRPAEGRRLNSFLIQNHSLSDV